MVAHPVPEHSVEAPAALAQPGLIMRLSQGLGTQTDVFQLEGFIDRDASQAEIDHLAEKMVRSAAKLKAKSELPNLRRSIENIEFKHNGNKVRLAEVNAAEQAQDEIWAEKIIALQLQLGNAESAAKQVHEASGRRGEFKAQGSVAGQLGRIKTMIEQAEEARVKVHSEAAVQRATLDNELKDGERALTQMLTLLAETEALARGEDISGV